MSGGPALLWIGLGGFFGSAGRYLATGFVQRAAPESLLPVGTAAVNISGCFAIGLVAGLAESRGLLSPAARAFLIVGLLGGFTTFSAYGYETLQLLRDGHLPRAALYAVGQLVIGIGAVWAGDALVRGTGS